MKVDRGTKLKVETRTSLKPSVQKQKDAYGMRSIVRGAPNLEEIAFIAGVRTSHFVSKPFRFNFHAPPTRLATPSDLESASGANRWWGLKTNSCFNSEGP